MDKSENHTFREALDKLIWKLKRNAIQNFPEPQRISAYDMWWLMGNMQILMDKLDWVCGECNSYDICPPNSNPDCIGPSNSEQCDKCWSNWKNADLRKE